MISVSPNPVTFGSYITVDGVLTPVPQNNYRVDFYYTRPNGSYVSRWVLAAGGYQPGDYYKPDMVGTWTVYAEFPGDDQLEGSRSNTLTFQVTSGKQPTTFTISVSPNPVTYGSFIMVHGSLTPIPEKNYHVNVYYTRPDGSNLFRQTIVGGGYQPDPTDYYKPDMVGMWTVYAEFPGDDRLEGSRSNTAIFEVATEGFCIHIDAESMGVWQGKSTWNLIRVNSTNPQSYIVNLSASGIPSGASVTFNPQTGNPPFTSNLTIITSTLTLSGDYVITVTGNGGGYISSNTFMLKVVPSLKPEPGPDFEISSGTASISMQQGQINFLTIKLASINNFASPVTLSLGWDGIAPLGISYSFSQNPVVPPSSVTLTFTASQSAQIGTFYFMVIGEGGGLTRRSQRTAITILSGKESETSIKVTSAYIKELWPTLRNCITLNNPFEGVFSEDARKYILDIWANDKLISKNFGAITVPVSIKNQGTSTAKNVKIDVTISGEVTFISLLYVLPGHKLGKWYSFEYSTSLDIGNIEPGDTVTREVIVPINYASVVVVYWPTSLGLSPWVLCLLPGIFVTLEASGSNTNICHEDLTPCGPPIGLYGIDLHSQEAQVLSTMICEIIGKMIKLDAWEYLYKSFEKFIAAFAIEVCIDVVVSKLVEGAQYVRNVIIETGVDVVKRISAFLGWGGSAVTLTAISPSGIEYAGSMINTTSIFTIYNAEPGEWTFIVYGEEVPETGEEFSLTLTISQNALPMTAYYCAIDKIEYSIAEPVIISFMNTGDLSIGLPSSPWLITNQTGNIIFHSHYIDTPTTLMPGEQLEWYWNQTNDDCKQVISGIYHIHVNTSAGTFIRKIVISVPPCISIPVRTPSDIIYPNQNVEVSVNVTDEGSGVENVTLSYKCNDSIAWIDIPMMFDSTLGLYKATIPGQPQGTIVKYKIIAYDKIGNQVENNNSGAYYVYAVVPEFPSVTIMLLFIILSVLAVAFTKKSLRNSQKF